MKLQPRSDQDALPAYLESSNLGNVPLYQHFGLHITGILGLPEGAPVVSTHVTAGRLEK